MKQELRMLLTKRKTQLVVIAWFATGIGMVVYGGGGKHIWDVTYLEYNWYYRVCIEY